MPALANASAATRVATLCKRNVFIVDCLSVHLLGIVHASPSILLPIAGIALGARPSAARGEVSVLGRPGILLFLGVDLLGFLLPFQLLVNEVELLIFLRPELLS